MPAGSASCPSHGFAPSPTHSAETTFAGDGASRRLWAVGGIGQLVTCSRAEHCGADVLRDSPDLALGIVERAAILVEGQTVAWVGPEADLDAALAGRNLSERVDAGGNAVVPGFVDCHTHIVFAGDRVNEFRLRARGASYEEIARAGGGIANTMRATREATYEALLVGTESRLARLLDWGVTTVEVKSGYGLDVPTELRLLGVVNELSRRGPQCVVPTFLGAHVVPPEYKSESERYVDIVVQEMLPEVARGGLARYCDVFCERGAFSVSQTRRIAEAALALGLGLRFHAEQLSRTGATRLGVELGAASVDHLEYCEKADIEALAASDTTAVLLPGATVFLNQQRWAPARALLDAGARVALSTDCNPGSCMSENLPLMGTLGCVRMGMDPAEALMALTANPAHSLGLEGRCGVLRPGARADFVILDTPRYENIFYHFGVNHARGVVAAGDLVRWHPLAPAAGTQVGGEQ